MQVEVKSSQGITLVPVDTRLMSSRKIFLEGEINEEKACEFVKKVLLLNQQDPNTPIDLLINSTGGEMNSGWLIYDVMQASKAPIRTWCMGRAYSMAAVLFASGLHGRYILPHGELMIHEPVAGTRIGGNSSSIQSMSQTLLETKKRLNQTLARHTGKTEEEIEQAASFDHYFNPEESVDFGLCDKIVGFDTLI